MSTTNSDIQALVNDHSIHFCEFDDAKLTNFQSVWKTRLFEAIEIHRRSDLQQNAQQILDFIAGESSSAICLYLVPEKKISFLYNVETKNFKII